MEAIILAGGLGTRLRRVIKDIPKPMAPINGVPFLSYVLNQLNDFGFKKVILAVSYKKEIIQSHYGYKYKSLKISYSEEETPLGTGGAIKQAMAHCSAPYTYILNGDTFVNINFKKLNDTWLKLKSPIIVTRHVDDRARYGAILKNEEGKITDFIEKELSGPGLINSGCYVIPKGALNSVVEAKFSFETDFLINDIDKNNYINFTCEEEFIDIGIPEDYELAEKILQDI